VVSVCDTGLVADARTLAADLLVGLDERWRHTQAVADRAVAVAAVLPEGERAALVAAAWLHDVGYAAALRRSGFHPLDAAWYLRDARWPDPVPGLVAHHSAARFVAAARGLGGPLRAFPASRYAVGPVADALVYADRTIGPAGRDMDVEERLAEMLRRHGPHSAQAIAHARRAPAIRLAVRRTQLRMGLVAEVPTGTTPVPTPS